MVKVDTDGVKSVINLICITTGGSFSWWGVRVDARRHIVIYIADLLAQVLGITWLWDNVVISSQVDLVPLACKDGTT